MMKRHMFVVCFMAAIAMFIAKEPLFAAEGEAAPANGPAAIDTGAGGENTPVDAPAPISTASGKGEVVDKTQSLKKDFHPKLKRILNVQNEADIAYLKVLKEEDQIRLADLIQSNIDSSSSKLLQRMATVSNFFPAFLLGKFAPQAGAEMAARLSYYVSPKRNVAIAKHTKREFLAESVYYLQPDKVSALMEATPDKLLVEIADIIAKKGDYYLMAEFADHLSVEKAKSLINSLNNAKVMINVGYYMKNTKLLGDLIAAMPSEDITRLIKEVIDLGYFEMAAKMSQQLEAEHVVKLFEKVDPAYVASITIHYSPELIVGIMDKLGEEHIQVITAKLTPEKCAALMNEAPVAYINNFWQRFPEDLTLKSLPHVDLNRLKSIWGELTPEVRTYIQNLAPKHQPLADMLQTI